MANRSFEFKIGADTTDFIKSMNNADKAVDKFDKQAQKLEKGLKIDFDESRFTQSQKLMQQALEQTEKNAEACRKELKFLEESGNADTKAYEEIQNQLAQTETKAVLLKQKLQELNNLKFTTLGNNLKKVGEGITTVANSMKAVSVASAAVVAGLAKIAKDTIATGDEIATLAAQYGITTTEVQKFQYIAMQSDVSDTALYRGLLKVNAAVVDLAKGEVNNATEALEELGLGADASFEQVISRLAEMTDATDQAYYANQIFGDRLAAEFMPLLAQGADAMAEYTKEFEEVGYLSEESVAELSRVDNVLNKLKASFSQLALSLGETLIPIVESAAEYVQQNVVPTLQKIIDKFASMSEGSREMAIKVMVLIPVVTALTAGIGKLIIGLGNIITALPKISAALTTLSAHPIIAIVGAVIGLMTLLYAKNEQFRESINRLFSILSKALAPVVKMLANALNNILSILSPLIDMIGNDLARSIQFICIVLEPLVEMLSWIMKATDKINNGLATLVGKGWLWGKGGGSSSDEYSGYDYSFTPSEISYPTVTTPASSVDSSTTNYSTDNSTVVNNITIEANEYTSAEEVARILSLKLQSRR